MSNGAYAGLRLAARAAKPDPEADPNETEPDDDEDDSKSKSKKKCKEDKPMDDKCNADAIAQARAEERNRFNTVLASDHYAGNTALAQILLGNDKLSADEIITALAAASPAPAAAAEINGQSALATSNADDAARAEMKAAIAESSNSNIDAGAPPAASADESASVWDQAYANCNFKAA